MNHFMKFMLDGVEVSAEQYFAKDPASVGQIEALLRVAWDVVVPPLDRFVSQEDRYRFFNLPRSEMLIAVAYNRDVKLAVEGIESGFPPVRRFVVVPVGYHPPALDIEHSSEFVRYAGSKVAIDAWFAADLDRQRSVIAERRQVAREEGVFAQGKPGRHSWADNEYLRFGYIENKDRAPFDECVSMISVPEDPAWSASIAGVIAEIEELASAAMASKSYSLHRLLVVQARRLALRNRPPARSLAVRSYVDGPTLFHGSIGTVRNGIVPAAFERNGFDPAREVGPLPGGRELPPDEWEPRVVPIVLDELPVEIGNVLIKHEVGEVIRCRACGVVVSVAKCPRAKVGIDPPVSFPDDCDIRVRLGIPEKPKLVKTGPGSRLRVRRRPPKKPVSPK